MKDYIGEEFYVEMKKISYKIDLAKLEIDNLISGVELLEVSPEEALSEIEEYLHELQNFCIEKEKLKEDL